METQRSNFPHAAHSDSSFYHLLDDKYPGLSLSESSLLVTDDNTDVNSTVGKTLNDHRSKNSRSRSSGTFTTRVNRRNLYFPNPILLLSTLWVVTASAGLATVLLVWTTRHITQSNLSEIWTEGAFLLDEGTHFDGSFEASRLVGLTIASASSIAAGTVTPILLSIYAYRSAHLWLRAGAMGSPTPLQYGLTIESIGAAGVVSLSHTGHYLLRSSRRIRPAPYMLKEAFFVSILAYILAHTIGAMDLWLHTATVTVTKELRVAISEPFQYGVTQTICPSDPYPPPAPPNNTPISLCGLPRDDFADAQEQGQVIYFNRSDAVAVIFPGNGTGIASLILQGVDVPDDVEFQMSTFGARATCSSFNPFCDPPSIAVNESDTVIFGNCDGAPDGFPQDKYWSQKYAYPPGCNPTISFPSNPIANNLVLNFGDVIGYPSNITQPGPYTLWLQLWFNTPDDVKLANSSSSSISVFDSQFLTVAGLNVVALATCNVSYFNVTLEYQNGSYLAVDETLTARFLSDAFSGTLRSSSFDDILIDILEPVASSNMTDAERIELLNQEMSRFAAVSAGVIADVAGPTLWQQKVEDRILGRYPISPVISLITILFINSVFAVVICILTATSRASKTSISGSKESLLELARLRLVSPFALIAETCRSLDPDVEGSSVQTNDMNLFNDKIDLRQIRVGVHEDKEGEAVFRMWIEKNEAVLTKENDVSEPNSLSNLV